MEEGLYQGLIDTYAYVAGLHDSNAAPGSIPDISWEGWREAADLLGVRPPGPAMRARQAIKAALAAHAAQTKGLRVDWGTVESRCMSICCGLATMTQMTSAAEAEAGPGALTACILFHDRHSRGGRSEVHYYLTMDGPGGTDGTWFTRSMLRRTFGRESAEELIADYVRMQRGEDPEGTAMQAPPPHHTEQLDLDRVPLLPGSLHPSPTTAQPAPSSGFAVRLPGRVPPHPAARPVTAQPARRPGRLYATPSPTLGQAGLCAPGAAAPHAWPRLPHGAAPDSRPVPAFEVPPPLSWPVKGVSPRRPAYSDPAPPPGGAMSWPWRRPAPGPGPIPGFTPPWPRVAEFPIYGEVEREEQTPLRNTWPGMRPEDLSDDDSSAHRQLRRRAATSVRQRSRDRRLVRRASVGPPTAARRRRGTRRTLQFGDPEPKRPRLASPVRPPDARTLEALAAGTVRVTRRLELALAARDGGRGATGDVQAGEAVEGGERAGTWEGGVGAPYSTADPGGEAPAPSAGQTTVSLARQQPASTQEGGRAGDADSSGIASTVGVGERPGGAGVPEVSSAARDRDGGGRGAEEGSASAAAAGPAGGDGTVAVRGDADVRKAGAAAGAPAGQVPVDARGGAGPGNAAVPEAAHTTGVQSGEAGATAAGRADLPPRIEALLAPEAWQHVRILSARVKAESREVLVECSWAQPRRVRHRIPTHVLQERPHCLRTLVQYYEQVAWERMEKKRGQGCKEGTRAPEPDPAEAEPARDS